MAKIIDIRWQGYGIPFVKGIATAHGMMQRREGVIIEVLTDQGVSGIGEIAPLPEFSRESGSLAEVYQQLPMLRTSLGGLSLSIALDFVKTQTYAPTLTPPVCCGLETALFDVLGKIEGQSVSALLATDASLKKAVAVNAVISTRETETAITLAQKACRQGFHCIKLKVGMDTSKEQELERIAAIREAIGPERRLRLDANEAWSFEEAVAMLSECAPYEIQYIEQPLKAEELQAMSLLRQFVPVAIAADEALHGLTSALHILEHRAADILVIKPQFAGGLRTSQQIIQVASEHGVRCVITSSMETGIGLAATLHLVAASPLITLECGLATSHLLADDLLLEGLPISNGQMPVPAGPGLGVTLDRSQNLFLEPQR